MDAKVTQEPMSRTQFQPFIDLARQACTRWGVVIPPLQGSVHDIAVTLRESLQECARQVSQTPVPMTYAGDMPGLVGSLPGISLEGLEEDIEENANAGDEWGICLRVAGGDVSFDVPLVYGIDQDTAESVLSILDGREHEFVMLDDIAEMLEMDSLQICAHADSWRYMKANAARRHLDLVSALPFRRPGAWDTLRGELSGIVPRTLPKWSEEDFQARFLLSVRYDMDNMAESREMLDIYSQWSPEPFTPEWAAWFPQITDLLHSIGNPRPIHGLSVVMHFLAEEQTTFDWEPVAARNVVVACGLDPVQAVGVLEYVRLDSYLFHDLVDTDDKRFTLVGCDVVPDAMLASYRVTSSGRSEGYDILAADLAAKADAQLQDEDFD